MHFKFDSMFLKVLQSKLKDVAFNGACIIMITKKYMKLLIKQSLLSLNFLPV